MVDVTIPYEGDADAFVKAERKKLSKYDDLVAWACQNSSVYIFNSHCWHLGCLGLQQRRDVEISGPTLQIHSSFQIFDLFRCKKRDPYQFGRHSVELDLFLS